MHITIGQVGLLRSLTPRNPRFINDSYTWPNSLKVTPKTGQHWYHEKLQNNSFACTKREGERGLFFNEGQFDGTSPGSPFHNFLTLGMFSHTRRYISLSTNFKIHKTVLCSVAVCCSVTMIVLLRGDYDSMSICQLGDLVIVSLLCRLHLRQVIINSK